MTDFSDTAPTRRLTTGAGLAAVACIAAAAPVNAQLTLSHYVAFNNGYIVDADLNGSGAADLGFGANLWFDGAASGEGSAVVAGNLSAPGGLDVAGNSARTSTLGGFSAAFYTFDRDVDLNLGEPEDSLGTGEHWVSFLARADAGADFAGFSFTKFFGDEVLYIGKVDDGTGNAVWGVDPQLGTGQVIAGGDATVDTLLVGKLTLGPDANDDTLDLFINPALGATPTTPDATVAFNEQPGSSRTIDEIRIGSQAGTFYFDELRIGGTFADVTPFTAAEVLGDYNDNGLVEQGDLNQVLNNWGVAFDQVAATWILQRPTEGIVDQAELNVVLNRWGSDSAPDFSGSAVPEPTGAFFVITVGGLLIRRRGGSRRIA